MSSRRGDRREIELVVHPTCKSSRVLLLEAERAGLLEKIEVRVALRAEDFISSRALSVPWLLLRGEPAAADPMGLEELSAAVSGEPLSLERDPLEALIETVAHSSFISAQVVLRGSLEPAINSDLVAAAVRAPLTGISPVEVLEELSRRERALYEEHLEKLTRALAVSFVRETWWASDGSLTSEALRRIADPLVVGAWLIGKAGIGRVGLPSLPRPPKRELEMIIEFIERNASGLISRVEREQLETLGDEHYRDLLNSLMARAQSR
ncbi:MAG: hypothetical protein QXU52_04530 [Fervidicoccaceae archaeon]